MNAVALGIPSPSEEMSNRELLYAGLMAMRQGDPIEDTLARMLASWQLGDGALPAWLGLGESEFKAMMARHFPTYPQDYLSSAKPELDAQRLDEAEDLRQLLAQHRTGRSDSEQWLVDIVIAGCFGSDHLWQDLGLWCRADLSKLMQDNFKPLAERNNKDMKWKKFLYKQLCETEGIYTCRVPSCEICKDYDHCFGAEN